MNIKNNPLWDPDMDIEAKLDWLLGALTLEEKFHMLSSGSGGIERLGIPECRLGGEAAHGVEARNDQRRKSDPDLTTSFPQPIGMSSSWDREAVKAAGRIVGQEARLIFNKHKWGGISRWAPTVDLLRDPRWGRNEEAYGEDPVQTGAMASAYIQGIQGDDPDHLMAAATLKHFYANNTEIGRGWKNSSISPRNKFELYLEPFRRCIEDGGAEGVMTAYNRINGVQGLFCEDVKLLLKEEFGLDHAVSDGGAMELAAAYSHATAMDAETVARSIKAGIDALSGHPDRVYAAVSEAYDLGLMTENDLNTAIRNVYRTKLKLGIFETGVCKELSEGLCSDEASKVCKRLTDSSIVLLKNDGILPIDDNLVNDCVMIGPVGDKWYQDWYGGAAPTAVSLLDGWRKNSSKTGSVSNPRYIDGCDRIRLASEDLFLAVSPDGRVRLSDIGDVFVMEDWGEDSYTFRNDATGRYLVTRLEKDAVQGIAAAEEADPAAEKITGRVCADAEKVFSWFDLEVFRLTETNDGLILQDRFGNRLFKDRDGFIVSAKEACEGISPLLFRIETVRQGIREAVAAASEAGAVILALGHHPMVNAKEEIDRATINFIPYQQKLFDEIFRVNHNIVVVLMSNYPFAINSISENARAILWSATGSQCMGQSLADALTGDVHPAGRLTQTWYRSDQDLPDIDDYDIIGQDRTYRYFDGDVLYPFGFGLTYTEFQYSGLSIMLDHERSLSRDLHRNRIFGQPSGVYDLVKKDDRVLRIELTVTNTGTVISDEVVQIYATPPQGRVKKAARQLIGFDRIREIAPGESRSVRLNIPVRELAYYDVIREALIVEGGRYQITAGSSSLDQAVSGIIDIDGETGGLRDMSKKIKADHYDAENGTQIVEGMYGYSALMAKGPGVYEPQKDGHIRVTYASCDIPADAGTLRIHGYAPENATIRIYVDGSPVGSLTLNTCCYERHPSEAKNHMPRAAIAEDMRKKTWPLLWADIYLPLDLSGISDEFSENGHSICIEAFGPFKYDWFSLC